MLQLLTLVCMEPPSTFEADKVRDEKVKVLRRSRRRRRGGREMTVRAQYTRACRRRGRQGYLEEDDVPDDSRPETYAALQLEVHNWRWAGVPIVLRTGKRLARKVTEIAVQLKPVPHPRVPVGGLGRRAAEPADPHDAAERGRVALARREDPGLAHAHPAR
jgi:glucose-6-phosphate 1-dehydrogenase